VEIGGAEKAEGRRWRRVWDEEVWEKFKLELGSDGDIRRGGPRGRRTKEKNKKGYRKNRQRVWWIKKKGIMG